MRKSFFAPALILIVFFVVFPVLQTVYISFFSPSDEFVGFDNYFDVLSQKEIVNVEDVSKGLSQPFGLGALVHNMIWISIHLPLSLFSGLILAIILRDVKGASIVKSAIFLGMVTPMIVGGIILRFTFEKNVGIVNGLLTFLGLEQLTRSWMAYAETTLFALIFGSVWLWTGFSMIVYSAGLTTIPKEYYEAAKIDGASSFRTFFHITFPLLKPMTITVVTMTLLWELKIFDIVFVAAGVSGGPGGAANVLALQMWNWAFRAFDFNRAATVATILTALTLVITIWMTRYMVKK
ncbi:MAG: sugar ABC transporter permease [Candidatus Bathyarchaeota archaeon]|nr:MAG: sugar ABC transporter permease [Candidatus Bathyarchaeota archaeon]